MEFLRFLSEHRTPVLDNIMQLVTYFGQEIIIIALICALYWCADKRFAYLLGFTYFTAVCPGIKDHIPHSEALGYRPGLFRCRKRRSRRHRVLFSKRPHAGGDCPLFPPGVKGKKDMA